ncbi:MAG TPA: polyphosphate kinase 2 family protein [Myxococcota bacterium]|nr:polyphosphate kinase 2 family protein [Myxococcota bacterium]
MGTSKKLRDLAERYRVTDGRHFRLRDVDPGETARIESEDEAVQELKASSEKLRDLQEKLYADNRWAILIILQGIDAAGKDGTIAHVMAGVNPEGCQVWSFKAPSKTDLDHDFLWRTAWCRPERGRIGIWNRSYYEEVLVVRVHPELLDAENLPERLVSKHIWKERCEDIAAHERYLARNGVVPVKFLLHISREEQRRRLLARLDEPRKNWKFEVGDVAEREHWKDYQNAFEDMVRRTASEQAPWYVVPANHKWFARLVVSRVLIETLLGLDPSYPRVDATRKRELTKIRSALEHQK